MSRRLESIIQQSVIAWWHFAYRGLGVRSERLLFAVPNAGNRGPVNGRRMKNEGLRAGIPDLFLAVPRLGKAGLFIELKAPKGVASDLQIEMMNALDLECYAVAMPRSVIQTSDVITRYVQTGEVEPLSYWLKNSLQPVQPVAV